MKVPILGSLSLGLALAGAWPAPDAAAQLAPNLLGESLEAPRASAPPVLASAEAPFAVTSRGRTAPRPARAVVVLDDAPARPAIPAAEPEAEPEPDEPDLAEADPAEADPPRREAPEPDPEEAPATRTHLVEWGDTWLGLAGRYGVSFSALRAANPTVDPERLRSGMVLRVPDRPTAPAAPAGDRRTHRVAPGESLWAIARRYGVSMAAIRDTNGLNDDRVRIGDTLVIPGGE